MVPFFARLVVLVVIALAIAPEVNGQAIVDTAHFCRVTTIAGSPTHQKGSVTATNPFLFNNPFGVAMDINYKLYVADMENNAIRKVDPAANYNVTLFLGGQSTTDCTSTTPIGAFDKGFGKPRAITFNHDSSIMYIADGKCGLIRVVDMATKTYLNLKQIVSWTVPDLSSPSGLAYDATRKVLYVSNTNRHTIIKIDFTTGTTSQLAGMDGLDGSSDGTGNSAMFWFPRGLTLLSNGDLIVADTDNCLIRRITPAGSVTTMGGIPANSMYQANINPMTDGQMNVNATFNHPSSIFADGQDNLWIVDSWNHRIRRISASGVTTTLAGYACHSVWPTQSVTGWSPSGALPNGGDEDGTGAEACFMYPRGIITDSNGTAYIAEYDGHRVKKMVCTVNCPGGQVDAENTCTSCPSGTFGSTGTAKCEPCPTGSYSAANALNCTLCPQGQYGPSSSAAACQKCAAGYYSSAIGAVSGATCSICPAGTYSSEGSGNCTLCPANTYSTTVGATSSSTCISCPVNRGSNAGSSSALDCLMKADIVVESVPAAMPLTAGDSQVGTYSWSITNKGPHTSSEGWLIFSHTIPTELIFVSTNQPASCNYTPANNSVTCLFSSFSISVATTVSITVSARASTPPRRYALTGSVTALNNTIDPDLVSNQASMDIVVTALSLFDIITTDASDAVVDSKTVIQYSVHFTNFGPSDAHNVTWLEQTSFSILNATSSQGNCTQHNDPMTIICALGLLPVHTNATITVTLVDETD